MTLVDRVDIPFPGHYGRRCVFSRIIFTDLRFFWLGVRRERDKAKTKTRTRTRAIVRRIYRAFLKPYQKYRARVPLFLLLLITLEAVSSHSCSESLLFIYLSHLTYFPTTLARATSPPPPPSRPGDQDGNTSTAVIAYPRSRFYYNFLFFARVLSTPFFVQAF